MICYEQKNGGHKLLETKKYETCCENKEFVPEIFWRKQENLFLKNISKIKKFVPEKFREIKRNLAEKFRSRNLSVFEFVFNQISLSS